MKSSEQFIIFFHYHLGVKAIPNFLKENASRLIEIIENMCVDDPLIVIKWAVPFPRNGRGQTKVFFKLYVIHYLLIKTNMYKIILARAYSIYNDAWWR